MPADTILHFCARSAWAAAQAQGEYRGDTLATEGFIHCSTAEQVHLPANALVRGRTDIVLLEVDPARVTAPVRWETGDPSDPASTQFPHVYGPIPIDAVVDVHDFVPGPDGTFAAPAHLLRRRP
ncbi:MAG TPA: DUF952 domain-containing protein [Jatrophihabitantaceae bacterium]|jgi:uncharacterized protein (DUF952 family)